MACSNRLFETQMNWISLMYEKYGNFINGSWRKPNQSAEVFSPATEQSLGHAPQASVEETIQAINSAQLALIALKDMGGFGRADALHKIADEMYTRVDLSLIHI